MGRIPISESPEVGEETELPGLLAGRRTDDALFVLALFRMSRFSRASEMCGIPDCFLFCF